jgi:hypothetical protein
MIFGDDRWKHPDPKNRVDPKVGIDAFVACSKTRLEVCQKGYQRLVRKTGGGG